MIIVQFISELAVGRNIEIYCLLSRNWINATIVRVNKADNQLYAQYMDGTNQHQWFSIYSPRLAPIGFKYQFIPNLTKRNNVPNIAAVVDERMNELAATHLPS